MFSTTLLDAPRSTTAPLPAPARLAVESLDSAMDDSAVAFTYCVLEDAADGSCRDMRSGQRRR